MAKERKQFDLSGHEWDDTIKMYVKKKGPPQPRDRSKAEKSLLPEGILIHRGNLDLLGRIEVKPMSVNAAWKGRRVKTDEYEAYETGVLSMLQMHPVPAPPYKLSLVFGTSNEASDIDNPVKLFIDILQKKYGFNDKEIYKLEVEKVIVGKRREFCEFKLEHLPNESIRRS